MHRADDLLMRVPGLRRVLRLSRQVRRLEQRIQRLERKNENLRKRNVRLLRKQQRLRQRLAGTEPTTAVRAVPGMSRLEVRRASVLESCQDDPQVLEIGPAHQAILAKRDGFRTRTVDYLDRDGLIERYRDFPQYSPDDIEEVDYVLPPGAAMADVIVDRFDLVVASHVIEHTTSLIDFLNECTRLLNPGGVVALVVPDHRYCFDRFRERSSIGRVIDAAQAPPKVHTVGSVIEEKLNAARRGGTTAWMPGHRGAYSFVNDLQAVVRAGEQARSADRYIDTHNWVFTPHHLRLLLQDLHAMELIGLRECHFRDTVRHEFFINLSLTGPGTGLSREELMLLADQERRTPDAAHFRSDHDPS